MIAKITRGAGFRGTLAYSLAREHQPEIVGSSMPGRDTSAGAVSACHTGPLIAAPAPMR